MKCIICHEQEATIPDREKGGRQKRLCAQCHAERLRADLSVYFKTSPSAPSEGEGMNLKEIENNNRAAKSRRKIAGFSDKRWMEEIDFLIAEVKRLRAENERLDFENRQFKDYVIKTGCSYTQTESDCECDYDYPWPCDHCPVLEHNKAIDTEMKVGNDNHN